MHSALMARLGREGSNSGGASNSPCHLLSMGSQRCQPPKKPCVNREPHERPPAGTTRENGAGSGNFLGTKSHRTTSVFGKIQSFPNSAEFLVAQS